MKSLCTTPTPFSARSRVSAWIATALLAGCSANPIMGFESGDKGVFFKRLSFGCVVGKARPTTMSGVALEPDEVYAGESVAHIASIERCARDPGASSGPIKVTRQILVGNDVVATNVEEVSAQITRNGVWEVRSMITIGKNPPGRYEVRTTLEADGRRQIVVEAFTLKR
jgi:hypothetical protein